MQKRTNRISWAARLAGMGFGALALGLLSPLAQIRQASTTQPGFFSASLYPVLEKAGCRGCHTGNGVASTTRLLFPPESASSEDVEAFGRSLSVLTNPANPMASLLLQKPTLRMEHTGGKLISAGSAEEALMIRWIEFLSTGPQPQQTAIPQKEGSSVRSGTPVSRRLTHSQYNRTVRDLLGELTQPANRFPQEDFVNGFRNQVDAQSIPPLLSEAYSKTAEKIAQNAYRRGVFQPDRSCSKNERRDSACAEAFIRTFGLKAFRRPLTQEEYERYRLLYRQEQKRTGEPARGRQIVAETMLQSPNFLFRIERGSAGPWKSYEMASRLSYFLWDTMPDESLYEAAKAGRLSRSGDVEREARRMLEDPRSRQALDEFVWQWLRFDRLLSATRERKTFPEFNSEMAAAMAEETRRLISHVVWDDRNFLEIFTADYSFVNSELAELYRIPKPAEEFGRIGIPAGSGRAGLLGQASFLTLTSKPAETSPTARGLFVREQFLCQKVPNPPPGTNMNLPPPSKTAPLGVRDRLEQHQNNPSCARCHSLIDSIGFGFEKFDAIGKAREKEIIKLSASYQERKDQPETVEIEIQPAGVIKGIPDSSFHSPGELGRILASTAACHDCIVKQVFRYALGRPEEPEDEPTLERVRQVFRNSGFRFQELLVALVTSEAFLN
ncbi:MAG: DUF1592 domain-containing protein [Acidobacteriota bacterium]